MRFLLPFSEDPSPAGQLGVLMNLGVVRLKRFSDQTAKVAQGICLLNSHPGATASFRNVILMLE